MVELFRGHLKNDFTWAKNKQRKLEFTGLKKVLKWVAKLSINTHRWLDLFQIISTSIWFFVVVEPIKNDGYNQAKRWKIETMWRCLEK